MQFLDVDECLTNPCENGALCNNTCGSFICSCKPAWEGEVCDQGKNPFLTGYINNVVHVFIQFAFE